MMSQNIKDELLSIQNASRDSMLHASSVVAWAKKNKASALHKHFDWNDRRAANEYRLWQARRLIQIHVVAGDGAPVLVNLTIDRQRGGGYRSVSDVVSNRKLSEIMLQDALAELERVRARYHRVAALTSVWKAVARVRKHAVKHITRKAA